MGVKKEKSVEKGQDSGVMSASLLMLFGIFLNYFGRELASYFSFPLWLDSVGTCIVASFLGSVCGGFCGLVTNVLIGLSNPLSLAYSAINILIGIIVGFCVKKGEMKKLLNAITLGALLTVISVSVSVPLNLVFYDGYSGNLWGNGVYDMLVHYGFPTLLATIAGEFFVDFPDKVLSVLITFVILKIGSFREFLGGLRRKLGRHTVMLLILGIAAVGMPALSVSAETADEYDTWYIPTIYNSENGLVGGAANDIEETSDGYIWVGTYAGLYRYDGISFTNMDEIDSVKNVNCLYVDEEGRLWIGTNDNGVSIYVKGNVSNVMNTKNGLSSDSVRCIKEDTLGNYYVGTSDSLCILTMENGLSVKKTIPGITYASDISVSEDGLVSVVTNSGNLYLLQDGEILESYYPDDGEYYYTSCEFLESGNLMLGTSGDTIYEWTIKDGNKGKTKTLSAGDLKNINAFKQDDNGNIWICSDNGIGYLDDEEKFTPYNVTDFGSSIDTIMTDYHGNIWFVSSRMGLLKLCETEFLDLYGQIGLGETVVNSVAVWNGYCYSGTDKGLDIIDTENKTVITNDLTERLGDSRIRCLSVDSKNQLWICTSNGEGLLKVDVKGNVTVYNTENGTIGNSFRSVLEMSDGTIVAAENTGLDFIKDGKVIAAIGEEDGLSTPLVLSLLELSDNTLLVGTDGGGIAVIRGGNTIDEKIGMEDGLTSGVILRMIATENGIIAVTSNSLCYITNENGKWQVTPLENFPYSNNYDIISNSNGKLWVLSSAGIFIVDEEKLVANESITTELLDSKRGLTQSLTANSWNCTDESGNLFLSCNTGVYVVNMESYNKDESSYRMLVEYLKADDAEYEVTRGETIEITKDVKRIALKPIVFNYSINDPYVSYYLEGFDDQPIVLKLSSLSEVIYTNLPSGDYTFHLSILDNQGVEVIESCSYDISLDKQIWEYNWFIIYFVIVCAMTVAYFTWIVTKLYNNRIIKMQSQKIVMTEKKLEMGRETIQAIAATVDAKDANTSQHSIRVAEYSVLIAEKCGWSKKQCENLRQIALLHDIGKSAFPIRCLTSLRDLRTKSMKL